MIHVELGEKNDALSAAAREEPSPISSDSFDGPILTTLAAVSAKLGGTLCKFSNRNRWLGFRMDQRRARCGSSRKQSHSGLQSARRWSIRNPNQRLQLLNCRILVAELLLTAASVVARIGPSNESLLMGTAP